MSTRYETIRYENRDGVATIRLMRPAQRNAVNDELAEELRSALEHVAKAGEVRAVILTGEGDGFCAGADVSQFGEELTADEVENYLQQKYRPIISSIVTMPKPVIAAIHGAAAGAGMSIALACDLRVMSDKSAFYPAFSNIGLVPDAGATFFLVQHLGYCRAFEFLAQGRPISADRAVVLGLANRVVRPDQLVKEAAEWARELAQGPTLALGLTKEIARRAQHSDLWDIFDLEASYQKRAIDSDDHAEGIAAFREKRKPKFGGT